MGTSKRRVEGRLKKSRRDPERGGGFILKVCSLSRRIRGTYLRKTLQRVMCS